jgi:urea transporter
MDALKAAVLRLIRAGVAFGVPALIQYLTNSQDPKLYALAPLLMAIGKYLRDTFKLTWIPV